MPEVAYAHLHDTQISRIFQRNIISAGKPLPATSMAPRLSLKFGLPKSFPRAPQVPSGLVIRIHPSKENSRLNHEHFTIG
ncbi:hypothetical protein BOTBODRAFT_30910 [Botryobasidium botryosum FD-172 SS1]|uniref:Uncharacterized protein n=1 Tax=Botryobasidium botryosum (strain FD-172 SS1) TaxID=930990 RepID=A0A067MXF6_BOTB1|nr:hypothetical protein BOTBODRAFT_30910 [Botryobasidium botryosum FD-172 SS1]